MTMQIEYLRCDHQLNARNVGLEPLLLTWALAGDGRGLMQSAYQVRVAVVSERLGESDACEWDSGKVTSDEQQLRYTRKHVRSGETCCWSVRVWDQEDRASEWSEPATWHHGLLSDDWQGSQWIGASRVLGGPRTPAPAVYLRREFQLKEVPKQAPIAITALGSYALWVNGQRVGKDELTPGWTDYTFRVPH